MASKSKISVADLAESAETLLLPLYFRALDSRQPDSVLKDSMAAEMVDRLDYAFSRIKGRSFSQEGVVLRALEFDSLVREFLAQYPDGMVVDIGCGLDTRFHRVDNGSVTWFGLDFPLVIALRRKLLTETPRYQFIGRSVLDYAWMDEVTARTGQHVFIVAEAVFPYLAENEVKGLLQRLKDRYPGSEIIFDGIPSILAGVGGRLHPNLWRTRAHVRWGLGPSKALEAWSGDIRLIGECRYYLERSRLFTGLRRPLRLLSFFFGNFKIVQYRLGGSDSC